jgi:2-iminobutanoate/2-iminopropanoate deaminase
MKEKISTDDVAKADAIFSQAIVSNGFIFVAGQIHNTVDGTVINGTVEEKLRQIIKNIEAILKAAGAGLDNIVKATVYVTDMSTLPELNKIYPTFFKDPLPAREAVCVKELPLGATLEISAIATKE